MTSEEYQQAIVSIPKETLAQLPAAEFGGKIVLVDKPEKVESVIEELKKADILGFDTETRPNFKKGSHYDMALIQLSTPDCCYLFRTNIIGFPQPLLDILENKDILKVGLSIHDDFLNLKKVAEVEPAGFIDLQPFVKEYKIADNSLSRLYAILFGERISKRQRLTNWEAPELTDLQEKYAALDAFACVKIYQHLIQGKFDPKNSPYLMVPPEPVKEKEPE